VIGKPVQDCFNVAANLDGYLPWCRKGGMKDVQVKFPSIWSFFEYWLNARVQDFSGAF